MIIVDDFIKDESLLKELQEDTQFFENNGQYMWWGGPWNSKASTLKQRLIEELWIKNSPWDFPRYNSIQLEGFEYWTGQYSADDDKLHELNMHFDKDENLWNTEGKLVTPIIGTVYYPVPMDIEGGYLEIFSGGDDNEPERIKAKHNRLVIFPAGQYKHRVTEVTKGNRSAIAINLWASAPSGVENGEIILEK
jgi:predicted 2-oxoglutarate/Fe(II)-dependent dioxygenase YbiX